MPITAELAERRFLQQATWTEPLRRHLFARAGLAHARRVLEIGCGPGALLRGLPAGPPALHGLDIDRPALRRARQVQPAAHLSAGDTLQLPYTTACFDICFFHYVLLWLPDPQQALREAARVTRPGGFVLAFAEPDYTARPAPNPAWQQLNQGQMKALRAQGANPAFGGQLAASFLAAGLPAIESGQLEFDPSATLDPLEAEVLAADLAALPSQAGQPSQLASLLAAAGPPPPVPTHFAWARVA